MVPTDPIPHFFLESVRGIDADEAQWRAAVASLFDVEAIDRPLGARLASHSLGEILIGSAQSGAQRFRRDAAVIARSDVDHLIVQLYRHGGFSGFAGKRQVTVGPGDVVIFDLARSFESEARAFANITLVVPRRHLGLAKGDPTLHGRVFAANKLATVMFAEQLRTLLKLCRKAQREDCDQLVAATLAALQALVRPLQHANAQLKFDRRDNSTLGRMARYIDGHIEDPELSIEQLARAFNVSRASLYRIFESVGGVAAYIRNLRLDRAFEEFSRSQGHGDRLNVLARRWGFSSEAAFSRAFKARFGIGPAELRRRGASAVVGARLHKLSQNQESIGEIDRWMQEISVVPKGGAR